MRNISAIFLIFVLVQFTFAQDSLELIEKSEEGKEVLDSVFLQVALQGPSININAVKATLANLDNYVRVSSKKLKAHAVIVRKDCKADIVAVKARYHDLVGRALAVSRVLKASLRRQARRAVFLSRANEELSHYLRFRAMMSQNAKAWSSFWSKGKANIQKVLGLLGQAAQVVRALRPHNRMELLELPEGYKTTLNEIRSEFENTFDNLDGLRPVIVNLLEVLRSPVRNVKARSSLRRLIHHLTEALNDKLNDFEEENEHQTGLFSSLITLFGDAVKRGSTVVDTLTKASAHAGKKIGWLRTAEVGAHQLAKAAGAIVAMRAHECKSFFRYASSEDVRYQRFLGVVSQLQEVIADRWSVMHSFFVQKMQIADE